MQDQSVQRRLAAILAADVVGYSRLMQADEAGTLTALKARRTEILLPLISTHHGRIVKVMGDGVLVEFAGACQPEDRRIVLRVGVNLGDVIVEGGDLYGDGVNVAARLEALAEPGSVYLSHTVFSHVRGKVQLGFDELGEQNLKNISEPIHVYRVSDSAGFAAEAKVDNAISASKPS